ncbi:MAG: DNA glycosylase AlkZ-like family protein, partial [Tepidiformaceae bacterium]
SHAGMLEIADAHGPVIDEMRAALRERRTVSNADFGSRGVPALDHYRGGKPTSLALYYLWRTGEAMTHHRERFQRVYAPTEDVAPAHLLAESPELEADLFLARKAVAFAGIGRAGRIGMPLRRLLARPVLKTEQAALEQTLVDAGRLARVRIESSKEALFVPGEDVDILEAIELDCVPVEWAGAAPLNGVSLLSPLDPVSARGRASALFEFDYLWEIYLPAEKVKFGRYTLPILWDDALVGRVDMKLDRQANVLVVNGLWFEDKATLRDDNFRLAFASEIARLKQFLGTNRVDAGAIASPLRRLFKTT